MEQLYIFGTGNASVTRCYNTCFALKSNDEYFMVDAGGGNGILTILEDMEVDLKHIHHLFATHEHTDHILGIIWMIRTIGTMINKGVYEGNLFIYCHDGLTDTISSISRMTMQSKLWKLMGQRILLVPVADGQSQRILDYDVTFFDIHSTKARQFGFTTVLESGLRLTCAGDEPYNPLCEAHVKGSDWLLHEAFCLYSQRDVFKPYEKHHSTVKDACTLAQEIGIPNLVLWHTEDTDLASRKALYLSEGAQYYSGNLMVPDDREIISL